MKIVIGVFTYWPEVNGVEFVTRYQAEGLVKKGHKVIVLTSDFGKYEKQTVHNGIIIKRFPVYKNGLWVKGNKKEFQKALLKETDDADVFIDVCMYSFIDQLIVPINKKIKCKKICILHGMHDFKISKKDFVSIRDLLIKIVRNIRWKFYFIRNKKQIFDFSIITHLHSKDPSVDYFLAKGYRNNRELINATEDVFFESSKKENIIINVSRFHWRKNQKLALDIFYKSHIGEYKLLLIGNNKNKYYNELLQYKKSLDEKYGKKNVEIMCGISREKTIEYIKKSKIYLSTSLAEHLPISILEAMASGSAFISTDVGVVKELPGGIICNSEGEFITSLEKLTKQWNEFGKRGNKYAFSNCRINDKVNQLESMIYEING